MRKTEEWLEFLTKDSEQYQEIILNQTLNDASGLGDALAKMIHQGRAERYPGVLLTGPAGSGAAVVSAAVFFAASVCPPLPFPELPPQAASRTLQASSRESIVLFIIPVPFLS